ncbi:MAG: CBS domain-containing protein [Thermoanaerobacterales bacterium]|nr:CBS domain-containing protein [Bacillota bacterium]MDI6906077.1 CBS domain-containing protein [Thermoanaerobacterales bacterium]
MAGPGAILARDIMVPIGEYPTVAEDATVREAIAALRSSFHKNGAAWRGPHALAVIDRGGRVVGMLSLGNMLGAVAIKDLEEDAWQKAETWGWYYIRKLREGTGVRVRDLMRPMDLVTVGARDGVLETALRFLAHRVNWVTVADKGRTVGIVRTIDIFPVIESLISG